VGAGLVLSAAGITGTANAASTNHFDGKVILGDGSLFNGGGQADVVVHAGLLDRLGVLDRVIQLVKTAPSEDPLRGLAVILNDDGAGQPLMTEFAGHAVGLSDILLKYTWNGDANLDGRVNADDYFRIDAGFLGKSKGFRNGDFNLDGKVNADDYFKIDSAMLGQKGTMQSVHAALSASAVPNAVPLPGAFWAGGALMAGLGILRIRKMAR
jgi:hypothetical protein